ncbi:MAG: condensation domain-containing protein, partial [Candidatus Thiodiazotropha sp.]
MPPICQVRNAIYSLSMPQREIWREHQLYPDSAVHTISARSFITGPLDHILFERALASIWERHLALRLTPLILETGNEPTQIELAHNESLLTLHDLTQERDRYGAAERLCLALGQRVIPLKGGPTCRFDLIRIEADCHIWVMSYHHINMDAWANGILMRDTAVAYSAYLRGETPEFNEAPPFTEAVEADLVLESSTRYKKSHDYWTQLYRTLPERFVEAVPGVLSGRSPAATTLHRIDVDSSMIVALQRVARRLNTTSARLFIAAALILFHRLRDVSDLSFGMPVLNRKGARAKKTFGLFSLTTAPRVCIDSEAGIETLLARLDRAIRDAMRHHIYPLSCLHRELALTSTGVLQLFDLNISYEQVAFGELPFGVATAGVPQVLLNGVERTPVEIFVREYGDAERVEVDLDFSLGAFTQEEAGELTRHYETILHWLSKGGEGRLSMIPLISEKERAWLLDGVNERVCDYGEFIPVHRYFEVLAEREPLR